MEEIKDTTRDLLGLHKRFEFTRADYSPIFDSDEEKFDLVKGILRSKGVYISDGIPTRYSVDFYMAPEIEIEILGDLIGVETIKDKKSLVFNRSNNYHIREYGQNYDRHSVFLAVADGQVLPIYQQNAPLDPII